MSKENKDEFELVAKHCPACQSLVLARIEKQDTGARKYNGYKCSQCDWSSPVNSAAQ